MKGPFSLEHFNRDLPAGIVVFLVAIPLCLGIALASGAPPLSGLIAGIVGGLVVSCLSGSALSVSGPAAGLTVVVLAAIDSLGLGGLLMAGVLAGALQLLFGMLGLGRVGAYVPSAVIRGMLAAIGLILILNQIPLALGFGQGKAPSLLAVGELLGGLSPTALLIALVSLAILVGWERGLVPATLRRIPAPLVAVLSAIVIDRLAGGLGALPALESAQRVSLPGLEGPVDFLAQLRLPDFASLANPQLYITAVTIALLASLETLLSLEAVDRIDPLGRQSPPHRELKAQGVGNMVSSLLGGLPMTAVIVRSSANVNAGGRTRLSSFIHGILLLASVAFLASWLELIPLACLAAILLHTGYKLARPVMLVTLYREGWSRFIPFVVTVGAVMLTNLLQGVIIGILCGLWFLVQANYRSAMAFTRHGRHCLLRLRTDVSFLNRQELRGYLEQVPDDAQLIIDGREAGFIDTDLYEDIEHFVQGAGARGIRVELIAVNGLSATYYPGVGEQPAVAPGTAAATG
ncbi:MFS superfamily sulfate permease-like transporter [Kushneria sinocarnis]|uniref:MFS superfamily sulfate permease-like transporter n=1 Tax=Kushneria sinocarnis TaxID=595502 RepID=A0A420X0Q9_9GAMM|nr:SulP family inorganic anion transporter [Kushneria sinocarnis]RKR07265.1 MFS superfamily sulfate permease-like transporter [Kushneria sinocarnis]